MSDVTATLDTVTLCTYTYNDGRLLDGLLQRLAGWTRLPERVVIVDDGSYPAYQAPALDIPTTLLRHETNQGVGTAKKVGIDAATTCFVLSLDCDVRLTPDWLERCLPRLKDPDVALCGSRLCCDAGQDTVSRFMQQCYGDALDPGASGPVDLIPGNVWLFKKAAWNAVQGFGPHDAPVGEDHAFCGRLRAAGQTLFLEREAMAVQIRKLTRTAMVRRFWCWGAPHYQRHLPSEPLFYTYAAAALLPDAVARIEQSLGQAELGFVYLELLYFCHCLLELAAAGRLRAGYSAQPAEQSHAWLRSFFRTTPRLGSLLRRDLLKLGHEDGAAQTGQAAQPDPEITALLAPLEPLRSLGVLRNVELVGLLCLLAEEQTLDYDFSFYEAHS